MGWLVRLKKSFAWLVSILVVILSFLFAESWLIASPRILGLFWAIVVVGLITTGMAWFSTYMLINANSSESIHYWIAKKEQELSGKTKKYLKWGKIIAIIGVDLTLGPIFVPFLLFTLNIKGKQVYLYSVACGFLFSSVWCSIYAGAWWGLVRLFHLMFGQILGGYTHVN
jgi:hypothetical protein